MPIASSRNYYQEGALDLVKRAKGPDVWVYRWRETRCDGKRVQRKRVIGTLEDFKTLKEARMASDNLRLAANAANGEPADVKVEKVTVGTAWGHFQKHELSDPEVDRSPTTIEVYEDNFKRHILPRWRDTPLEDVKPVAVEQWLRSMKHLAPGTKAKFRNQMSCLFSHALRHELFSAPGGANPMKYVRQSSRTLLVADKLTLVEIRKILDKIDSRVVKLMVIVAATSALRRSEVRGLKWQDIDFAACWIKLSRGSVRKHVTKMKTKTSRKGIPIMPEVAKLLADWRQETPYPLDWDWVFASPFTHGLRPYWCESAMADHVLPAVKAAGVAKQVGWHTFRRSLASLLGEKKEDIKVVQELLRHSTSTITRDLYQQGDEAAKRHALTHSSSLFDSTSLSSQS